MTTLIICQRKAVHGASTIDRMPATLRNASPELWLLLGPAGDVLAWSPDRREVERWAMEVEADDDIANGRVTRHPSAEAFIDHLDSIIETNKENAHKS